MHFVVTTMNYQYKATEVRTEESKVKIEYFECQHITKGKVKQLRSEII